MTDADLTTPTTVDALVIHDREVGFTMDRVDLGRPRPNEIVVRIVATGLCHTDLLPLLPTSKHPLPIVVGHEGAGVVVELGDQVTGLEVGDHVVLSYDSCGTCEACRSGRPFHCDTFGERNFSGSRVADGTTSFSQDGQPVSTHWFGQSSFADHAVVSARCAVKVPKHLPLDILGPLGCGIQTGSGAVLNTLAAKPSTTIAIFGAGPVGLSATMAAALVGCKQIVVVDVNDDRLAMARSIGATHTINAASGDPVQEILELSGGQGVLASLDTAGAPGVAEQAIAVLKKGVGVCGIIAAGSPDFAVPRGHIMAGRKIVGVIEGDADPHVFIPQLLEYYEAGRFPFDRLISRFPASEVNEALEAGRTGGAVKSVLVFDESYEAPR